MQEKLSREEQSSLWGLHKVRTLWRSAQRKAKDQELRQDIEILSQTFARVMDCKDGTIEALVTELKEAEEQQNRALSSHLDLTDQLLQLQRCRLGYLEQGFSAQVGALKAEFEAERRAMLEQQDWESWVLQEMELATEQEHARSKQEALLNFQSARDDIKNKCWQDQQYSRLTLGARLEGLWEQIQTARRNYAQATEKKKVEFEELKRKCEKTSCEINAQAKRLEKLQDMVTTTRGQIAAHLRKSEEQTQRIRGHREDAHQKLQKLRAQVTQASATAHTHLVTLSSQCSATLKVLQQLVEKVSWALLMSPCPVSCCPHLPIPVSPPGSAPPAPGRAVPQAGDRRGEGAALLPLLTGRVGAAKSPQGPGGDGQRAPGTGDEGLHGAGEVLAEVQQGQAGGEGAGEGTGSPGRQEPGAKEAPPAVPGGGYDEPEGAQRSPSPPCHQAKASSPEMSGRAMLRDTGHGEGSTTRTPVLAPPAPAEAPWQICLVFGDSGISWIRLQKSKTA
uniref:Dynein regulatory complex subunit 2 n=1 Tax=Geospiza parvula TaxID=87175 RepID=A0A8C3QEH7_GEOPR